ncbi:acyl-CoA thioesterase [Nocardioides sp.]|uniref:acyl-CoA thioesterase n=1 Tax=Nocardioides sp. TaxID=35761 RepID=UPI003516E76D
MSGEVFECEIQARFRDINLGGHVDNVEAIRVLDEARILFFRFADLGDGAPGLLAALPSGVAELAGSQRIDYHAEMRFVPFAPFQLRLWISHLGRSSFTVSTELRVAADHPPAVVAQTTLVCWDHAAAASWPMDEAVRTRLSRFLGPPVPLR